MELIRGLTNLKPRHRGCVATIGNYDGVHLGHQLIIRQLTAHRDRTGLAATIITFEPQPQEFFAGANSLPRLSSLREKLEYFAEHGVDRVLCLRFNRSLADMSAERFIDVVLASGLDVGHLVVGDDFRFGHDRRGNYGLLEEAGRELGFTVEHTATCEVDGSRVSSTRVRQALAMGEMDLAARLLGRRFSVSGKVAHGEKRGRDWGFPTVNIPLNRRRAPVAGIFTVEVYGLGAAPIPGVANLGIRPTVDGTRTLLEVHLLDFDDNVYGARIRVEFLHKLRDEVRFDDIQELKDQIRIDKQAAEAFFSRRV